MMKTSFPRSAWLSSFCLVAACGTEPSSDADTSTSGPKPTGRVCNQPMPVELQVVDIAAAGDEVFYVLLSDQSAFYWGAGYPPQDYAPLAEPGDQPCLHEFATNATRTIGRSYEGSLTVVHEFPSQLSLPDVPVTLELPDGRKVTQIAYSGDIVAVDELGEVWVLWRNYPAIGRESTGQFEKLELPAEAVFADGENGWCVTLESGDAWCLNRAPDFPRFGKDIGLGVPESLDLTDVRSMVMSLYNVCYLDSAGSTWCAGSSGFYALGYEPTMFEDYLRDEFDIVPGLPPFERLWARDFGTCGVTGEGDLWCWGSNGWEQFKSSSGADKENAIYPTHVGTFPGLKTVAMAPDTTCVLNGDNIVLCRGLSVDLVSGYCHTPDKWFVMPFAGIDACVVANE